MVCVEIVRNGEVEIIEIDVVFVVMGCIFNGDWLGFE